MAEWLQIGLFFLKFELLIKGGIYFNDLFQASYDELLALYLYKEIMDKYSIHLRQPESTKSKLTGC